MAGKQDNAPKVHDKYLAEFAVLAELVESDNTSANVIKQMMQCKGEKFTFRGKEIDGVDWEKTMGEVADRITAQRRAKNPNAPAVKFSHRTFIVALSKSTTEDGEYYREMLVAYWQAQLETIAPKKAFYLFASMSESKLLDVMTLDAELKTAVGGIANYIMTKEGYTCYRQAFAKKSNAKDAEI
jgi:hypothetical protein